MTAADTIEVEWTGRRVAATIPATIANLALDLPAGVVRRTERAAAAIRVAGAHATGPGEVAARLLLRAEGLASSAIEGLRASPAEVAIAAAGSVAASPTAAWVADNLAVVTAALAHPGPLTTSDLHRWHHRLMNHATGLDDRHRGAFRDVLGWVGGRTPHLAAHVAAPAGLVGPAMEDLVVYANRADVDPVTQAAVLHAQFETIHPYADGNGRLGRLLIGRTLAWRLGVPVPPPVSLMFARDVGGYLAGLTLYRQGQPAAWVSWFADAVEAAAEASEATLVAVGDIAADWDRRTAHLRSDSAARRLLPLLPAHPVLSASDVAALVGVSTQAGLTALASLADAGVVDPLERQSVGGGRPRRWWAATALLELLGE